MSDFRREEKMSLLQQAIQLGGNLTAQAQAMFMLELEKRKASEEQDKPVA
jgi:hypothetical protein